MPADTPASDPKYILSVILEAIEHSDLRTLVQSLQPFAPSPSQLLVEGTSVKLPSDAITSFALVLFELATNAIKHGAWSCDVGLVIIDWRIDPNQNLDFR
jgi:two-component sensor histidine kinase